MKKVLSLFMSIIFILFTFSSCNEPAPEIDYSDKYVEGQDAQESNFAYQMSSSFAETDESLYAFVLDTFFVIDKQSHKAMPLCFKPDCKHDRHSPDCEAQKIGSAREYMGKLYYKYRADKKDENGIIYYVDQICSMNYDGTDKKVVFETKRDTFLISYFKLHRGYFYMWISYQDDEGGYSSDNAELVRLKIGDTEPESILDLSDGKNLLDVRFSTQQFLNIIFKSLYRSIFSRVKKHIEINS